MDILRVDCERIKVKSIKSQSSKGTPMATNTVYSYLKLQNRPYSLNDIASNLHNEFGKTAVQKVIDKLVEDKKIIAKMYGKQKIYCAAQEQKYNLEESMRISKELQIHAHEIEIKYKEIQKEIQTHEATLKALKSSITLEEAKKEKEKLQESIKHLTNKLDELMETTGSEDLVESKRKAQTSLDTCSREYSKRKRICTEILECILENYPASKKELYEDIGIESKVVQ